MSATVHATMRVVVEIPIRPSSTDETMQQMLDASKKEAEGILRNRLPKEFRVAGPVEFVRATVIENNT